jgi:hypothetical protein
MTKTATKRKGLAANLEAHAPGVIVETAYWIGAFPACCGEGLDVAGINFPKINEEIRKGIGSGNNTERIPRIGAIARLSQQKVDEIREKLPQCVIRFKEPETATHQTDALDYTQPRRNGQPIRIPTEAQIKAARKVGRNLPPYVRRPFDEPAARFLFAVPCTDQNNPTRGEAYPESLEDIDIEWPKAKADPEE